MNWVLLTVFIDSCLTWNSALRVGVLLMRIELYDWQIIRMSAYVLCSDGNSSSNSSWLLTHPPPLLSPFLFFLTKTNSYSQLTTKRTHKRAYMVSAHFVYHDCPMSQLLSESLILNACDTLICITSRLFISLPQMDRITVMSVLPLDHICTIIIISFKFWCITSVIFFFLLIHTWLITAYLVMCYALKFVSSHVDFNEFFCWGFQTVFMGWQEIYEDVVHCYMRVIAVGFIFNW